MDELDGKKGFLKGQYDAFRKTVCNSDLKKYANLKTDVERCQFVKEMCKSVVFPMIENEKKNVNEAVKLKSEGNRHFQEGKNGNALNSYSQSLLMYPANGDETEIAIIRANRSAALYHLEEFQGALNDIELALENGYPKHLRHKVLDRKAKCLMALKRNSKAIEALRQTLTALDDSSMTVEARMKKQHDIQIMLGLMAKNKTIQDNPEPVSEKRKIIGDRNAKYKAASKSVNFNYSETEGRFAQADRNILSGEVILREKAHVAVLLPENALTHCFQCMKRVYILEPCPNCTLVRFCSRQCQIMAETTHHKYECGILRTLWNSGASVTSLMSLRAIIQRPLNYFLQIAHRLTENQNESLKKCYDGRDYCTIYHLERHEDKRSAEGSLHKCFMALFLHECLVKSGYFDNDDGINEEDKNKGKELTAGLILRNLQAFQFNAHEISELLLHSTDSQKWKSKFVGGGVFPTLALFNHSCEPSIIRYFEGSKVVATAIKKVKKGEPIFENYGPIFTQTVKKERQLTLKNQYWFDCNCEPCTRNWPTLEQMDSTTMRFHCDNADCDNVVIVSVDTNSFMSQCNKCGKMTNILKGLKALQDSESLFQLGQNYLKTGDALKGLKKFLELQHILSENLEPPFKDFYLCQQNLRNCLMAYGNSHPPFERFFKTARN